MVLPICMLRTLQMRLKQKFCLIALFSTAIIIVIFDAVRIIHTVRQEPANVVLKYAYSTSVLTMMEVELAVIISALTTYGSLFGARQKRNTAYSSLPHPGSSRPSTRLDGFSNMGDEHELHSPVASGEPLRSRGASSMNVETPDDNATARRII